MLADPADPLVGQRRLSKTTRFQLMKSASILLALVVVLTANQLAGQQPAPVVEDYTIQIGNSYFGFVGSDDPTLDFSCIWLGPFGPYQVPFSPLQGVIGFCVIFIMIVVVLTVLTVRWKRRKREVA